MLHKYYWLLLFFLPCLLASQEEDYTFIKIFLFNCTNPEAVSHLGANPHLEEVGPYTFLQEDEHVVIWQSETSQLFWVKHHYLFVPEMSSGDLDDTIVTINPSPVFAAERTRWPGVWGEDDYPFMQFMISESIKQANESLFLATSVRNITFDGIDSPLFHTGDLGGPIGELLDETFPFDRFGYFYDRRVGNGSLFGLDFDDQIITWNGERDLGAFYPRPCDQLTGSLGHKFPPNLVIDRKPLSIFSADVCRPLNFNFQAEAGDGEMLRYVLDSGFVGDASVNASNSCYNPYPDLVTDYPFEPIHPLVDVTNVDLVTGLVNTSQCINNYPMYVSYPHFYLGDYFLGGSVDGLKPDAQKHESYIKVDHLTGEVKESLIRLQYNILLRDLEYIEILENVPTVFFPVLWTEVTTMYPVN